MKKTFAFLTVALAASPLFAFAAFTGIKGFLGDTQTIINTLIRLCIGLAILVFFWGLVKFIGNAGEKSHEAGRNLMVWGVIALVVMASIGGLIAFISGELGIKATPIPITTFGGGSGANGTDLGPNCASDPTCAAESQ